MVLLKTTKFFTSSVLTRSLLHFHHCQSYSFVPLFRQFTTSQTTSDQPCNQFKYASLRDRSIIRLSGPDTVDFLQGLVTNDVRLLFDDSGRRSLYSFILNVTGRILADMFIYRVPNQNDLLLEMDFFVADQIRKLLKRYKIRRKIDIRSQDDCQVTVVFPQSPESTQNLTLEGDNTDTRFLVQDPRSHYLGYRMVFLGNGHSLSGFSELNSILAQHSDFFNSVNLQQCDESEYRIFRYLLGIGEGCVDFPPEEVFPFEANAELLNAVSFQKGCYTGQELVARTYHTGVIRKRYLPVELMLDPDEIHCSKSFPTQNVISEQEGKEEKIRIMGRFRTNFGNYGLASLKYGELFEWDSEEGKFAPSTKFPTLKLIQSDIAIQIWRPFWWPESV